MIERFYPELLGYFARALRDRDSACDIVQESYARLLSLQLKANVLTEPRALLFRIGKNLVIDEARRLRVERDVLASLAITGAAEAPAPDAAVEASRQLDAILARLAVMPIKRREAYVLVRIYGYSHAEAAQRLATTVASIEKHVVRGTLDCASLGHVS